jgi:NADPH:quinone reductase-like Zn-dependent oxidoreductase
LLTFGENKNQMKAAVINNFGETPHCEEFPNPLPGDGETLIQVKAAVLENFDKAVANGMHYASGRMFPKFPAVAGHSGIGMTPDGKLVGFGMMPAPYGAFAEKTVAKHTIPIPDGFDAAIAAALPAAVLTSFLPLKFTVKLAKGETVLINGATGVSGKVAIQVAKLLGAGKVIGTGRNEAGLRLIKSLGSDSVIDLKQPDEKLLEVLEREAGEKGFDVVIDFLWGRPAELIMKSFVPKEAGFAKKRIRYVQVGEAAISQYQKKGSSGISITGEMLRTSGLELYGVGNISQESFAEAMKQTWEWIRDNKFYIDIEKVPLADIEKAWQRDNLEGKRIVIVP